MVNVEKYIRQRLEEDYFEDILEEFDLDPIEVFLILFESGYIDEDLLL